MFLKSSETIQRTMGGNSRIRDVRESKTKNRVIYINNVKPYDFNDSNVALKYASNRIKTSKYTILNFVPKNLFEQFRRIANFYYLLNLIVTFIIPDPPVSPFANMIPIAFVILVTAVKQGYEDILRHRSDREINNTPVRILKNGTFVEKKWKDIKVGDIVEVLADQTFPCDLLLLHAHTEDLMCQITTANLDGETNLKQRRRPANLPPLTNEEELSRLEGVIQCDKPNADLFNFNGNVLIKGNQIPIVNDNILLRGCNLRIAPIVYGCAIYTGLDTKIFQNTKFKRNKLSCIEKRLNRFVLVFLAILLGLALASFGGSFAYNYLYDDVWYLDGRDAAFYKSNKFAYYFTTFILYMNLFNYIIPLSLYVTVELQRFVGSKFLEWDLDLYDPITDQPAKANTSDLNEDLGQIEYLFSDKTGTLTENEMIFKQFSIDGIIYEYRGSELFILGSESPLSIFQSEKMTKLFQILSLCHTVHVDNSTAEKYQASSPDEFSFVKFCSKLGLVYEGEEKCTESSDMIRKVKYADKIFKYKVLDILEFDSDRKRMSVILRDLQDDKIILLCKGAESSILKNCVSGNIQSCDADIKTFAKQGWRTLALSYRYLTNEEYNQVEILLKKAYNDILNRKERLSEAFEKIESKLILIGATAVEDKLQEDVAYTLEELRRAGIKIWVLTGDKRETAINISHSCKHFSNNMIKLLMTDINQVESIKKRINFFQKQMKKNPNESFALVIDGRTLELVFANDIQYEFRNICMKCDAVLCCRMTPVQKANVVRLVKKSEERPMTAAIGDGANDVSMIQEADIGLGIFGKEERFFLYMDFCITLEELNLVFAVCQFYFAIFSAFSVSTLYNSTILMMYNVLFTAFPALFYGLFEQKLNKKIVEKTPFIYQTVKKNKDLRSREFFVSILLGTWHSLVAFFFAYAVLEPNSCITNDGVIIGSQEFGVMIFTQVFLVVHIKLFIDWQHKTYFIIVGFGLSIFFYLIFCFLINSFIMPDLLSGLTDGQSVYWVYNYLFGTGPFWFYLIVATVASLLPDIFIKILYNIKDNMKINKLAFREALRKDKLSKMESFDIDKIKDLYEEKVKDDQKKRVRVFYVPSGVNRVFDTKVRDIKIDHLSEDEFNQTNDFNKTGDLLIRKRFKIRQRY
ncbi:unnamed protein product [Brachionus calyciflorus]|uniref:P-type phospholipid transporter n=1 Tax=Brachionus calyciflorus TaxID=104777 RepID=A0A814GP89_9BILA|nr:unnamed protein product [Brachionus calyciflorus]